MKLIKPEPVKTVTIEMTKEELEEIVEIMLKAESHYVTYSKLKYILEECK